MAAGLGLGLLIARLSLGRAGNLGTLGAVQWLHSQKIVLGSLSFARDLLWEFQRHRVPPRLKLGLKLGLRLGLKPVAIALSFSKSFPRRAEFSPM
jgi:hypothetical protein